MQYRQELPNPSPASRQLKETGNRQGHQDETHDAQPDLLVRNLLHFLRNRLQELQTANQERQREAPCCKPERHIRPVGDSVSKDANEVSRLTRILAERPHRLPVEGRERQRKKDRRGDKGNADQLPAKPILDRLHLHIAPFSPPFRRVTTLFRLTSRLLGRLLGLFLGFTPQRHTSFHIFDSNAPPIGSKHRAKDDLTRNSG